MGNSCGASLKEVPPPVPVPPPSKPKTGLSLPATKNIRYVRFECECRIWIVYHGLAAYAKLDL